MQTMDIADQNVHLIHQPLNVNQQQALAVITILASEAQPLDHVQAIIATARHRLAVCHMALLIAIIHTASRHASNQYFAMILFNIFCTNTHWMGFFLLFLLPNCFWNSIFSFNPPSPFTFWINIQRPTKEAQKTGELKIKFLMRRILIKIKKLAKNSSTKAKHQQWFVEFQWRSLEAANSSVWLKMNTALFYNRT